MTEQVRKRTNRRTVKILAKVQKTTRALLAWLLPRGVVTSGLRCSSFRWHRCLGLVRCPRVVALLLCAQGAP